jgi:hypothetical protein
LLSSSGVLCFTPPLTHVLHPCPGKLLDDLSGYSFACSAVPKPDAQRLPRESSLSRDRLVQPRPYLDKRLAHTLLLFAG